MGFAIAEALAEQGAIVTLVTGPSPFSTSHPLITVYRVRDAQAMYEACVKAFPAADGAILAAAVADYRPKYTQDKKIKKQDFDTFYLELEKTPDILGELGRMKEDNQLLLGFSLETDNPLANAKAKLRNKRLDGIVLNQLNPELPHFGQASMSIILIRADETTETMNSSSKEEIALKIVNDIMYGYKQ